MKYNVEECIINENKIFLKGWNIIENSKILIIANKEQKYIQKYYSRYDIEQKNSENNYGFKEEISFDKKIKYAKIYIEQNKKRKLIYKKDERKISKICKKIAKIFNKIFKGIKFLWREYHFFVPFKMMKKYLKMTFEKKKVEKIYNPEIDSQYNEWFDNKYKKIEKKNLQITIVNIDNKNNFNNIETKYTCILNSDIELCDAFNYYLDKYIDKDYDLIYFDNDKKIDNKICNPILKPDFSPDTLLGVNYIGNCIVIKTDIIKDIQVKNIYSLLLNIIDKNYKIQHIPEILYHDKGNIKNEKKIVEQYLKEKNINYKIKENIDKITNIVEYIPSKDNLVSIIIPTKDHADYLEKCLTSIYEKTTYKNYEIIVIDNNSMQKETFELFEKYKKKYQNFKTKRIECEFNYSYLNNEGVKISKGNYILLLNNDIEVISPNWLEVMLGYAEQQHVGAVGVKLLFPDNTMQHAGVIMGKGGLVGHIHYAKPKNYASNQYELLIPYNYSVCTAACLLINKKKYEEIGGLEEKLKVNYNDVDFNLKLIDKGYYNVFLPNICLYHYESKSRGLDTSVEKQKRFEQEWNYIEKKWSKYIKHDKFYNDNFSKNNDYMLIEK